MMDLSTTYLGFRLPHPLMPGASPLSADLDTVRRLEDAGAAAIILPSLFEEQIDGRRSAAACSHMRVHEDVARRGAVVLPAGRRLRDGAGSVSRACAPRERRRAACR